MGIMSALSEEARLKSKGIVSSTSPVANATFVQATDGITPLAFSDAALEAHPDQYKLMISSGSSTEDLLTKLQKVTLLLLLLYFN